MPSVFTLEGPQLNQHIASRHARGAVGLAQMWGIDPGRLVLWLVGGAALLGVAWHFANYDRRRGRRSLRGLDLKTIAKESRSADEFARRAEAWNAGEARPLPVSKLAAAYRGAKPATVARLIREAREARVEGRERLWSKMSRGLRGDPPKLRVGQRLDYIGQTFVITAIRGRKDPVVYIARPSKDSFGKEHLIDPRSFPLSHWDRQQLKTLDGLRGLRGGNPLYYLNYRDALKRAKRLAVQTDRKIRVAVGEDARAPGRPEYVVAEAGNVPTGFTVVAFADPSGNIESSGSRHHRMMKRRGLDGYRVAYGTSAHGKTFRIYDERTLDTVEQATRLMRSYKRQGLWTWVEDEQGNFVPVEGARRESIRKSYPKR